jgi:hypothetical protein
VATGVVNQTCPYIYTYNIYIYTHACVTTAHKSQQYPRKLSTKNISNFFIDCPYNIFYEHISTIDSKSETSSFVPHFQGFVEQEGKGRDGRTCSLPEKHTTKTYTSRVDIGSIPLDI